MQFCTSWSSAHFLVRDWDCLIWKQRHNFKQQQTCKICQQFKQFSGLFCLCLFFLAGWEFDGWPGVTGSLCPAPAWQLWCPPVSSSAPPLWPAASLSHLRPLHTWTQPEHISKRHLWVFSWTIHPSQRFRHLSRSARLSSWLFWTVASSTAISPLSSSVCFSSSPTLRWLPCHSLFIVATFSFRAVTCTLILASASSPRFACSSLAFFSANCERRRFNLLSF